MIPTNPIAQRLIDMPSGWAPRKIYASAAGGLSFAGLRDGMLRIAGWLAGEGVRPGDRVALCLPKSLEAVQVIYGILAAGAAYVPLQFQGPQPRLQRILDQVQPRLLLATAEMAGRLAAGGVRLPPATRILEDGLEPILAGQPVAASLPAVDPESLAAVFFTSGSTGEPKGVMWSHRGMAATIAALPRWGRMTPDDRLISLAGLHYAASADIFYPLHAGSSCYLLSEREAMFAAQVADAMERDRTTIWSATATALRLLEEGGNLPGRDLGALRRVEIYGEPMPVAALRKAMAALPGADFFNLYAASEAFDMIEFPVPRPLPADLAALPLGRPSPIYELSLRDEQGREVSPGEIGEIVVAGPSVLLGYWQDADLTAAKRLAGRADSYRSGDLACLGTDGLLHLVGRKDHVVKLRGHRFDLGEIEATLRAHPAIRDAVAFVLGEEAGDTEVAALVLGDGGGALAGELRRLCAARLPAFARPARIAVLAEFPLLSSGKVDRRALKAVAAGESDLHRRPEAGASSPPPRRPIPRQAPGSRE